MTYEYILYFPLLLGILLGVDKRVGFQHAIDDEQYVFSYSGLRAKHRTSYDLVVTRDIEKVFEKSLRFRVKYSSRGKVQI